MIVERNSNHAKAVLLVTGSDTGVGKTVFTGLLGRYLNDNGVISRLAKPFCSGGRGDIDFLAKCCGLSQSEVNYWYDNEPVSPMAWELRTGKKVDFKGCVKWLIKEKVRVKKEGKCGIILVEGVGGFLAPLAKGKTVASLGQALGAKLIVVASNRVGVVNHVLLTLEACIARGVSVACVVLIEQENPDSSSVDNAELIRMSMPNINGFNGVFDFPWLGEGADDPRLIQANVVKSSGVLEMIFDKVIKL